MTRTPTETPVAVVGEGRAPVYVESGPDWLATLLYEPPGWVWAAAAIVVAVAVLGVALGLRWHGLDREVREEKVATVSALVCCGLVASILGSLPTPWLVDVIVAVGVGLTLASAVVAPTLIGIVERAVGEAAA